MKTKIHGTGRFITLVIFFVMASIVLHGFAQSEVQTTSTSAEEGEIPEGVTSSNGNGVTINVKGADITEVLTAFSRQTGKSIVIGPEVEGEVSMRLTKVPWQDALEVILKPYGYGYTQVGDTIVINRLEKIMQVQTVEPIVSRVFQLKYLDANDVRDIIVSQLSDRGEMSVLSVRGQKGWEFASDRANSRSGQGSGESIGKRQRVEGSDQVKSKIIIVADIPSVISRVETILDEIDRKPQQILIEARFVEVNSDLLKDIGLEWGTGPDGATTIGVDTYKSSDGGHVYGVGAQSLSGNSEPSSFAPNSKLISATKPYNSGLSLMFEQLTDFQFEVLLHALEEDVSANILSAPRVLTLNNQEATIIVGTKFPIIKSEVSGDSGTITTSLEYYEEIGIQLNVVPQISDDDFINMIVHPAVTEQIGTASAKTGAGSDIPLTEYPIMTTREAETQILIESSGTIVIGGLLKEVERTTELKVPFLGDIPLLGRLFRRDTTKKEKLDLLIFLTATIVEPNYEMPATEPAKAEVVAAPEEESPETAAPVEAEPVAEDEEDTSTSQDQPDTGTETAQKDIYAAGEETSGTASWIPEGAETFSDEQEAAAKRVEAVKRLRAEEEAQMKVQVEEAKKAEETIREEEPASEGIRMNSYRQETAHDFR
ncbi:MAG: secretin and TonB N-terminal domain-containing protein [Verrucomicrobia bacterium]|nr:secretin and TonB N-terminal domain-containing protein [Verrucomicrobiota bacterium]